MNFMNILLYNNNSFKDLHISELLKSSLTLKIKNIIKNIFTHIRNIDINFSLYKITFIKLLYFKKNIINPLLYEFDKIINLDYDKVDNISYYFYLTLLIENNPNVIDYYFSIQFIKNINKNNINNNNNIKKILLSKIIIDLIKYYRGLEESENNLEEIKKIEDFNIKIIKNNKNALNELNLNFSIKEIKSKTIEEIYLEIIISLIKNKLENYQYIENLIKQLDIESIIITPKMFNEIKAQLDNTESDKEYMISKENDLFDNKKITLYYILLKYICKEQIFIYQINFFLKTRIYIIKLIKSNSKCFENSKIDNIIKERLEYIIEKITDSKYYMKKYDENRKFNSKNSDKELNENYSSFLTNKPEINTEKENNFISSNMTDTAKLINEEEREKEEMKYISQISQRFCLIKKKSIIGDHKNKKNQKNEKNEKKQYTADYIIETSKFFISSGTSNEIIIYTKDFSFETKFKIPFTDWVYNILENKERDYKKENYMLATQGKQIILFKVIIDKKAFQINPKNEVNPLFSLKIGEDFLVCCQNKVVIYSSNLLQKNLESQDKVLKDNYIAKGATKINNFVLLKSNKICSMGKDNLLIFNIVTNEIDTCNIKDEYSFVYSQNGLTILSINIKNKKDKKVIDKKKNILLCACKKYIKNQKNGILLLTGFEESTKYFDIKTFFFDTGKFEVYCFCPILIFDTNNIINKNNITNTNYFLVGGFEKVKNKGLIKLFKVIYCNEHFDYRIEFIQDIELMINMLQINLYLKNLKSL